MLKLRRIAIVLFVCICFRIIYVNINYPKTTIHYSYGRKFEMQGVSADIKRVYVEARNDYDVVNMTIAFANKSEESVSINPYEFSLVNGGWYSMMNNYEAGGEILLEAGNEKQCEFSFIVQKEYEELIEDLKLVYLGFEDTYIIMRMKPAG